MWWTLLSLVACDGGERLSYDAPEGAAPIAYDWSDPSPVELGGGWTLDACEGGGGPVHCLYVGDIWRGTVEHLAFASTTFESLAGEGDADSGMDALVEDFEASTRADRAQGCRGWIYEPHPVRDVQVAGHDARAYGFSLDADGIETDRSAGWLTWIDDTIHVLATEGLADGACMQSEGAAPTPGELASLTAALDRVAAGSVFPE